MELNFGSILAFRGIVPIILVMLITEMGIFKFPKGKTPRYLNNIDLKQLIIMLVSIPLIIHILLTLTLYRSIPFGGLIYGMHISGIIFYFGYVMCLNKIKDTLEMRALTKKILKIMILGLIVYLIFIIIMLETNGMSYYYFNYFQRDLYYGYLHYMSFVYYEEARIIYYLIMYLDLYVLDLISISLLHLYFIRKLKTHDENEDIGHTDDLTDSKSESKPIEQIIAKPVEPEVTKEITQTPDLLNNEYSKFSIDELIGEKNKLQSLMDNLEVRKDSIKSSLYFKLMAEYTARSEQVDEFLEKGGETNR